MCAAHVSARCNLRDIDALEARLEEYKEGRAPCDLCSRLNWRWLLQADQTLQLAVVVGATGAAR